MRGDYVKMSNIALRVKMAIVDLLHCCLIPKKLIKSLKKNIKRKQFSVHLIIARSELIVQSPSLSNNKNVLTETS